MYIFMLPLRLMPDSVHAKLFAMAFNHMLRGQTLPSRLKELDGKSIMLHITDVPCKFHFRLQNGQFYAIHQASGDVTISGELNGFWQLATRQQDPDTLFFKRELNIEGDTETGVHIKNLLDSLDYDWDAHFDAVLFPPLAKRVKQILHIARCYTPKKLLRHFTIPDIQPREHKH